MSNRIDHGKVALTFTGESWDAGVVYDRLTVVDAPDSLSKYMSLRPDNVGHALSDEEWWMKWFDGGRLEQAISETLQTKEATEGAKADTEAATRAALATCARFEELLTDAVLYVPVVGSVQTLPVGEPARIDVTNDDEAKTSTLDFYLEAADMSGKEAEIDGKLAQMRAEINEKQLEVGAVPVDEVPTAGSAGRVTSGGLYATLKDSTKGFVDEVPTAGSDNLVKSGGVFPLKKTLNEISEESGNMWTYGDQSFKRTISFDLDTPIQPGTYTLSAIVTSTGTDATESRMLLMDDNNNNAIFQLARNVRASATSTLGFIATKVTFYAETGGSTSVGDDAVWSNIQLEVGSTATDYKPDKTAIDYKARDAVNSTEQNTESLFNNYVCKNIQEVTSFARSSGYINKPTVGSVWTDAITANSGYNYISGGIDVSAYNTFDGYIIISTPTNESNAAYWGFADSEDKVIFTARHALSSAYTRYNEETNMYELVVKVSGDKFFYSNKVAAVIGATFKLLHASIADNKVLMPQTEKSVVKYVSATGNNSNDGNSPASPYATMAKALAEGAQTIILAKGSYTESFRPTGVNLKIIGNGAEFTSAGNIMYFTNSHVEIEGVKITATGEGGSCFYFKNCTGTVTDCYAGSNLYMGFRISGSKMTFIRCVAENANIDGFNGHDYTENGVDYICDCTFIDCVARNCGDDGLSFHERGKMHVFGGEFCGCTSTGIAPHNVCDAEIRNAYIHDNGSNGSSGIEAEKSDTTHTYDGEKGRVMSFGNLITGNGGYGINVEGYTYFSVKDSFDGNTSGTIHADGSEADIHEF